MIVTDALFPADRKHTAPLCAADFIAHILVQSGAFSVFAEDSAGAGSWDGASLQTIQRPLNGNGANRSHSTSLRIIK